MSSLDEQLLQASYKEDAKAIQLLVDKGANIDATLMVLMEQVQKGEDTPQMLAPIEALLKAGASVKDDILFYADCSPNLIKLLLKYGANANYRDEGGYSVLHRMSGFAGNYCEDALKILIKAGADVNARTDNGNTPLMMIAYAYPDEDESPEGFITILLEAGANIDTKNNDGKTVLDLAKDENNIYIVNVLKSIIPKSLDEQLLQASIDGDAKKVQTLLDDGANIETKDEYDWRPLHLAVYHKHNDIVTILLKAGANIKAQNDDGTALHIAANNNNITAIYIYYLT